MSVNMQHCLRITLFLFLCPPHTDSLFGDSLKKLRQKASDIYKSKHAGRRLNFMGQVSSDYPGTNPKYIKINEELWEEYYTCLKSQQQNLGKYLSMSPEAILGFEGGNAKLQCKICINPQEKENMNLVVWEWAPIDGVHLEPVEFHENIILSPEEKTLQIYNLDNSHSGQYVCTLGEAATTPYFLTVINVNESELDEVHNPKAPLGPYPKEPQFLQNYDLVLDTEWSEWSSCSTCGKVGKRHKLGYCSIYSKENKQSVTQESSNTRNFTDGVSNKTETTNDTEVVISVTLELFNAFPYGIPCHSHIIPQVIRELSIVQTRKNEIMIGFCKIECPKNELYVVKDKHGNIIEQANNSAGIYSMLQPLPPLEPPVARKMIYGWKGRKIVLTCPGSMNTDAPVQWQIGSKNLIAEIISAKSKGRIYVTITDRIYIKYAKLSDSNIYSCWQRDELAGTIRLIIEKKIEFNFNHTVMLIGIVIIMIVFLKIFIKAIIGRKHAKV